MVVMVHVIFVVGVAIGLLGFATRALVCHSGSWHCCNAFSLADLGKKLYLERRDKGLVKYFSLDY